MSMPMRPAPKNYKYTKQTMTIRDFLLNYSEYDVQPVGQRLDTQLKLENPKSQGIINTIMIGIDIGQITVHKINRFKKSESIYEPIDGGHRSKFIYESIDGGHRKRYIKAFVDGKIRTKCGRYYSELTQEEKAAFLNYELSFVVYSDLSVYDIGYIFRTLNETTDVNHQEMLNSYGNIPIANAVRNTVRPVPGINNKIHSFFEFSQKDGQKKTYVRLGFDNKRLRHDEMVARIFYRYYDGGGLGKADESALEELYQAELNQKEVDKLSAKVSATLTFLENMSIEMERKLSKKMNQTEFSLFSRIWLYMEKEYGDFKINDNSEFYDAITKAYAPFTLPYDSQPEELRKPSPWDASKTRGQQFKDVLGFHKTLEPIFECLMWLLKEIDMPTLVTLKDPKRIFPRAWREARLVAQGFTCAVSGEPLTMEDAHGAHVIAHSEGGKTEYDNLVMVSSYHNRRMGTMSVDQYRELIAA